jgi:hypothetical protein
MKQSIVAICGWIIPEPLAMAANLTALAADVDLAEGRPWCAGRWCGSPRRRPIASSPSAATSAGTAAADPVDGQRDADRARRRRQHVVRVDAQRAATAPATARSSSAPRGPDERVGVAAVGDDRADASAGSRPAP